MKKMILVFVLLVIVFGATGASAENWGNRCAMTKNAPLFDAQNGHVVARINSTWAFEAVIIADGWKYVKADYGDVSISGWTRAKFCK